MIPKRFEITTVLLLLAPLSAGLGSWLIFQARLLVDPGPINGIAIAETGVGVFFFSLAFVLFFSGLGVFGSSSSEEAEKWLRWLGGWKPKWGGLQRASVNLDNYRQHALGTLLLIFLLAILLIPGIGEDRQFPVNQFYGFFGSLWYFYAFAIGIVGFVLIYKRRVGGYILGLILSFIAIGTDVTDVLGLQPPSPPTFRTSILQLASLPPSILLAYVSWRTLHAESS